MTDRSIGDLTSSIARSAPVTVELFLAGAAVAQPLQIAVRVSLTGISTIVDVPVMNAVRLAVEEANARGGLPPIIIEAHDDRSDPAAAREIARSVAAGQALVVMGPGITPAAVLAGPIYGQAGIANIVPHAHGAPEAPTTFRIVFGPAEMGAAMANHLFHVLGQRRVAMLFRDNPFGRPIAEGCIGGGQGIALLVENSDD